MFITGTDTGVGKTYVGSLIARELRQQGVRVGVYKPVASGCRQQGDELVSDDAVALWEAAGRPGTLEQVCPQRFAAPLAPPVAARAAGRRVDGRQLRGGLTAWQHYEFVIVEGAGGLLSPLSDQDFVADLALDFGFPLLVVARNALGVINHTLQTLHVAQSYFPRPNADFHDIQPAAINQPGSALPLVEGLPIAGVVLNDIEPSQAAGDPSTQSNADELWRLGVPLVSHLGWGAQATDPAVDWRLLAARRGK